jgi:hypothetical protein
MTAASTRYKIADDFERSFAAGLAHDAAPWYQIRQRPQA